VERISAATGKVPDFGKRQLIADCWLQPRAFLVAMGLPEKFQFEKRKMAGKLLFQCQDGSLGRECQFHTAIFRQVFLPAGMEAVFTGMEVSMMFTRATAEDWSKKAKGPSVQHNQIKGTEHRLSTRCSNLQAQDIR
jgi:hypothetical protein